MTMTATAPPSTQENASWAHTLLSIRRNKADGKISGLSAAIADVTGIDVSLIRLLFFVAAFGSGVGLLAYLAGWALTDNAQTGRAPLDRITLKWRNYSSGTIVGWTIALIAVFGISIGAFVPYGWLPLLIVALAILTSQGMSYGSSTNDNVEAPPPTRLGVSLGLTALVTALAAGVGFTSYYTSENFILAIASALLIVGVSKVIAGHRHRLAPLSVVGCGLLLTLIISSAVTGQNTSPDLDQVRQGAAVVDTSWTFYAVEIDLSDADVTTDQHISLASVETNTVILVPEDANVRVRITHDPADGREPEEWVQHHDDGPWLHITVESDAASVKVRAD